ncbi:MAG: hypothetical protein PXY39_05005 [archaeon]|nr:hypothetical protein [archaeon]
MSESEAPREIVLEARNDGQNLQLLQRVFQSSRIKVETVSSDPIRIKLPATTRAVSVLLLLLEELKPEGSIILDGGSTYNIDEEGISKLRRIAIRSLSTETAEKTQTASRSHPVQVGSAPLVAQDVRGDVQTEFEMRRPSELQGFRSNEVTVMTMMFALLIGVVAAFVTILAFVGKMDQLYSDFIFGVAVVGAISVMHRYAGAFKQSKSS